MSDTVQIIIPTITRDYLRMRDLVTNRVFVYLPVRELIFIGNRELCSIVNEDITDRYSGLSIKCICEDELIDRQPVINCIRSRVEKINPELLSRVRPGWYYQQFLKMIFFKKCEGDYYMSWDMDTVPLRNLKMFDDNDRPLFDIKSEYNPGYFKTIENLLGITKKVEGSFVSEHMIFNKIYMEEMIQVIEETSIEGEKFWEKIIGAVEDDYMPLGFSEFETYGTFVAERHHDFYGYRRFNSFRRGSWFLKESELNEDDIRWLTEDYDAITFENAEQIPDMAMLFRNPKYRNNMSARKFYETILESGYFGEYSDGRLIAGDWFAPV